MVVPVNGPLTVTADLDFSRKASASATSPYFSSDYTADHLKLPAELRANVSRSYYPAGHMIYLEASSRRRLHGEVKKFMDQAMRPAK